MPKPGQRETKPSELKRIGDYVEIGVGERLEGERIDIEEILGEDVALYDFVFISSTKYQTEEGKKGKFAVIQFKRAGNDDLLTTACGGKVVVTALEEMPKQYLPITIRITLQKSKSGGGRYYNIE